MEGIALHRGGAGPARTTAHELRHGSSGLLLGARSAGGDMEVLPIPHQLTGSRREGDLKAFGITAFSHKSAWGGHARNGKAGGLR